MAERALHAWITVKPVPTTLHETSAILAHVNSIAPVKSFLNPRYRLRSGDLAVQQTRIHVHLDDTTSVADPLQNLLTASPFEVSIKPEVSPREADPFGVRGLALRKKITPKIFCCQAKEVVGDLAKILQKLRRRPALPELSFKGHNRLYESLRRAEAPLSILQGLSTPPNPIDEDTESAHGQAPSPPRSFGRKTLAMTAVDHSFPGLTYFYNAALGRANEVRVDEDRQTVPPAHKEILNELYASNRRNKRVELAISRLGDEIRHRVVQGSQILLADETLALGSGDHNVTQDHDLSRYLESHPDRKDAFRVPLNRLKKYQVRWERETPEPLSEVDTTMLREAAETSPENTRARLRQLADRGKDRLREETGENTTELPTSTENSTEPQPFGTFIADGLLDLSQRPGDPEDDGKEARRGQDSR